MLQKEHFYHKTTKTAVSVFGTLFNNIQIKNVDNEGSVIKTSRVPISYAQKDKLLQRINSTAERDFDTNRRVAVQLPRMSFELSSFNYDSETSVSMMKKHNHRIDNSNLPFRVGSRSYSPAPYKLGFQLHLYSRLQDEVLQMLEQILPYFRPDFLVSVRHTPESSDSHWDIPITLTGVTPSDSYEGGMEDRRVIVYTLDFDVLVRYFGPITDQGVIQKVIMNFYADKEGTGGMKEQVVVEAVPTSPSENGYVLYKSQTNSFIIEDP